MRFRRCLEEAGDAAAQKALASLSPEQGQHQPEYRPELVRQEAPATIHLRCATGSFSTLGACYSTLRETLFGELHRPQYAFPDLGKQFFR